MLTTAVSPIGRARERLDFPHPIGHELLPPGWVCLHPAEHNHAVRPAPRGCGLRQLQRPPNENQQPGSEQTAQQLQTRQRVGGERRHARLGHHQGHVPRPILTQDTCIDNRPVSLQGGVAKGVKRHALPAIPAGAEVSPGDFEPLQCLQTSHPGRKHVTELRRHYLIPTEADPPQLLEETFCNHRVWSQPLHWIKQPRYQAQ